MLTKGFSLIDNQSILDNGLSNMSENSQETYNRIDSLCSKYVDFDTPDFIGKLKSNSELRRDFYMKNELSEDDLLQLFKEYTTPIETVKGSRLSVKKQTSNIIKDDLISKLWFGMMGATSQVVFRKVNSICSQHNENTVDFIYRLKNEEELRSHFLTINQICFDDFVIMCNDTFLPVERKCISSISKVRNDVVNLLELNNRDSNIEKIKQILYGKNKAIPAVMNNLDRVCSVYGIVISELLEALKRANLDTKSIGKFKFTVSRSSLKNLRYNISTGIFELDGQLCKFNIK